MTGETHYYKIPLLTKLFRINFYLYWRDDKFYRMGFERNTMTFKKAIIRLERKRLWREKQEENNV